MNVSRHEANVDDAFLKYVIDDIIQDPQIGNEEQTFTSEENLNMVQKRPTNNVKEPREKLSEYEKIRERNIAERKKLFQDLKISQLKAAAISPLNKTK